MGGGATPEEGATPVMGATPVAGGDLSQIVYDRVKSEYEAQFGLTWLERSVDDPAQGERPLVIDLIELSRLVPDAAV